jgi:hypothetical protein
MDSSKSPDLIEANQFAFLINVSLRGGKPKTRPGFNFIRLTFDSPEMEQWFLHYPSLQGQGNYDPGEGTQFPLVSVGGRIFRLDPKTFVITEITPEGQVLTSAAAFISPALNTSISISVNDTDKIQVGLPVRILDGRYLVTSKTLTGLTLTNIDATPGVNVVLSTPVIYLDANPSNRPMAYFKQMGQIMYIQDGQSGAIIYDGSSSTRANPAAFGVPTGTAMEESGNRLYVAIGKEIAVSDLMSNETIPITFQEETLLDIGGRFRVREKIVTLIEIPTLDTSLGQGPILVCSRNSISALNLPFDRQLWKPSPAPLETLSLKKFGPISHYSTTLINGDVFYVYADGVRSFMIARRDFGSWGNVPLSREIARITKAEGRRLRKYSSGTLFDNRFLFTVQPVAHGPNAYFSAIASMDFDLVSGLRGKAQPVWEGAWTGINPIQILICDVDEDEKCFCWAHNSTTGGLELWEIAREDELDLDNDSLPIESWFETRRFNMGGNLFQKKLHTMRAFVSEITGSTDFKLQFRPDNYPCYYDWGPIRNICAKSKRCALPGICLPMTTFENAYKTRLSFGKAPDVCNAIDKKIGRYGFEFQLLFKWTGHARIDRLMLTADPATEFPQEECG